MAFVKLMQYSFAILDDLSQTPIRVDRSQSVIQNLKVKCPSNCSVTSAHRKPKRNRFLMSKPEGEC